MPLFSIAYAADIQTNAVTEPTEISIPPVIMTNVIPQPITIKPAFEMNRFINIWGFAKPLSSKIIIPAMYITANNTIVIINRNVLLLIFLLAFFFSILMTTFHRFIVL